MSQSPSADRLLEFKTIVEAGSISQAADLLNLTRPTLSRRLAELEETLGLRLLQRTTRDLYLTTAGRELYIRAERIAADVDATWNALKQHDDEPRGPLRISVPDSELAAAPVFTEFAAAYPKVELDVVVTNHRTDLRAAGIDVALIFGAISDPSLVSKSVFSNRNLAMASRSYLADRGMPESPQDIKNHDCIVLRNSEGLPEVQWPLASGGTLKVRPRMLTAGFRLMVQAVEAGLGIGMLPEIALNRNPDLVPLFPDHIVREDHLRLAYVEKEFQLPHVRAFIERSNIFWKTWLQEW